MATQTWPAGLPQGPADFSQAPDQNATIRTTPDSGPTKMRRRFTKVRLMGAMSFVLSIDQRNLFWDFFNENLNAGTERFNFYHPWDRVVRDFRITNQPSETAEGPLAVRIAVNFELF